MALEHVSYSAMNLYDECAKRYQAQRLRKVPEAPAKLLVSGILVHEVVSDLIEYMDKEGLTSLADQLDFVAQVVQDVFARNQRATATTWFSDVMISSKVFAKNYVHDVDNTIGLEQKIEIPLADGYPKLLGYLDHVQRVTEWQNVEVATGSSAPTGPFIGATDYKSGWSAEQTDANVFQGDLQALLLHGEYPDEEIAVRNYFTRSTTITPWRFMKPWDYDNARRRAMAIYDRMQASYKKRNYPATPGKHCGYCVIALECADALALRDSQQKALTLEDAQRQTLEIQVLKAAVKQLEGSVKDYVDVNGRVVAVQANGSEIEASYKLPKEAVTLKDLKLAYEAIEDELFTLFGMPLAAKLKKYEDDPRLSGQWIPKVGKPRFSIGKYTGGDDDEV